MRLDEVRARLEKIREVAHDPEDAHVQEDELYIAVLDAIARGQAEHPAALAAEALRARDIKFPHFYA